MKNSLSAFGFNCQSNSNYRTTEISLLTNEKLLRAWGGEFMNPTLTYLTTDTEKPMECNISSVFRKVDVFQILIYIRLNVKAFYNKRERMCIVVSNSRKSNYSKH